MDGFTSAPAFPSAQAAVAMALNAQSRAVVFSSRSWAPAAGTRVMRDSATRIPSYEPDRIDCMLSP